MAITVVTKAKVAITVVTTAKMAITVVTTAKMAITVVTIDESGYNCSDHGDCSDHDESGYTFRLSDHNKFHCP